MIPLDGLYRDLVEACDVGYYAFNREGFVYANEHLSELLGAPAEDILGSSPVRFVAAEHRDVSAREIQRRFRGEKYRSRYQFRIARGDAELYVEAHGHLLTHAGQELIVGSLTDITKEVVARRQLTRSEVRHRTLTENARDAVLILSKQGRIQFANAAFCRITGLGRSLVMDAALPDLVHEEDKAYLQDMLKGLADVNGAMSRAVLRVRGASGGWAWLEALCTSRVWDRAINGIIVNARDITDLQAAESRLDRQADYHRALLDDLSDAILELGENHRVEYVNRAGERISGFRAQELVGADLKEYIHPEDLPEIRRRWAELHRMGDSPLPILNARMRTKDGSWRTMQVSSRVRRQKDGAFDGLVVVARDVTRLVEAESAARESEERFLHAQKMEAIGRLAGGVAHDFNNSITAMKGHAELILQRDDLPEGVRADIEAIVGSADRTASLTRQLLAFSRRSTTDPELIDLNDVVRDVETMARRLLNGRIELTVDLPEGPLPAFVDASQIEQVVMNLIVNARDAMPSGGHVEVHLEHRTDEDGDWASLTVVDDGEGMDKPTLARAFEPFFTTKGDAGTGLGLPAVYGVVQAAGGTMSVHSQPDQGTRFSILFPLWSGPEPPAERTPVVGDARLEGQYTVLVVEDEEPVRRYVVRALERAGCRVLEARDGAEAVSAYSGQARELDLLVTDVSMPRMDGVEVVRRFRERHPSLPVMMMSGFTEGVALDGALDEIHSRVVSWLEGPQVTLPVT